MQLLTCFSLLGSQFFSKEKIFLAQYLVCTQSLQQQSWLSDAADENVDPKNGNDGKQSVVVVLEVEDGTAHR